MKVENKTQYRETVTDSTEEVCKKGVNMGNSPFLWQENSPNPYTDSPGEKFVPAPVTHAGEASKTKRILKYIAIGLLAAFVLITFVVICMDAPQTLFRGDTGRGHFFQ